MFQLIVNRLLINLNVFLFYSIFIQISTTPQQQFETGETLITIAAITSKTSSITPTSVEYELEAITIKPIEGVISNVSLGGESNSSNEILVPTTSGSTILSTIAVIPIAIIKNETISKPENINNKNVIVQNIPTTELTLSSSDATTNGNSLNQESFSTVSSQINDSISVTTMQTILDSELISSSSNTFVDRPQAITVAVITTTELPVSNSSSPVIVTSTSQHLPISQELSIVKGPSIAPNISTSNIISTTISSISSEPTKLSSDVPKPIQTSEMAQQTSATSNQPFIGNVTSTVNSTTMTASSAASFPAPLEPIPPNSSLIDNGTNLEQTSESSPITRLTTMWTSTTARPTTKRPLLPSEILPLSE